MSCKNSVKSTGNGSRSRTKALYLPTISIVNKKITCIYEENDDGGSDRSCGRCLYKNYGYFGDNHGNILCINLNNMKPVWYYDNHDDIDATIVCEEENGVPFVYTACEVDRQGDSGMCHIAKLNGLNGEVAWAMQVPCTRHNINYKHFDGGMYSTPLLGGGNYSVDCRFFPT